MIPEPLRPDALSSPRRVVSGRQDAMRTHSPAASVHRYSVVGFIDKNKDTLFQDFKRLLYNR